MCKQGDTSTKKVEVLPVEVLLVEVMPLEVLAAEVLPVVVNLVDVTPRHPNFTIILVSKTSHLSISLFLSVSHD